MNSSKESKTNLIRKGLSRVPKKIKQILMLTLVIVIGYAVLVNSEVFRTNSKSTKFGLEDVGELVTQTAHLTIVQDTKVDRKIFKSFKLPFTESRQIFSYDVEIDASVDFSKVSYNIDDENSEVIIKLPHAKIYKTTLDTASLKIYIDEESLFSRIDLKKQNDAVKKMEEEAKKDAKENGLLVAADENAKALIEGFIEVEKRYKDYKIVYKYIEE